MRKIMYYNLLLYIMLSSLLSCSENNSAEENYKDTLVVESAENIAESENLNKIDKSIVELLRSLDEDTYGGVSHLKDQDFNKVDNEKMYIEYTKADGAEYITIAFMQIAFGDRNIFVKTSYDRYDSGNSGYFQMGSIYLLEYKEGSWIDLKEELPGSWKIMDFAYFVDDVSNNVSKYKIKIDNEGNVLETNLIETASWIDDKLIVTNTGEVKKNDDYKIVVAYLLNPDEVSEDWNYIFDDVDVALKNKGIYVVMNDRNKAVVKNADISVEIDLEGILKKNKRKTNCYIFLENGREAKCVDYEISSDIIKKAELYYK